MYSVDVYILTAITFALFLLLVAPILKALFIWYLIQKSSFRQFWGRSSDVCGTSVRAYTFVYEAEGTCCFAWKEVVGEPVPYNNPFP